MFFSKFLSEPNLNPFISVLSRIPLVSWQPGITALTVVSDVLRYHCMAV